MAIPTCSWVRSRLPLLAGRDAVGLDHRHVERHLMRCPDCRARFESLRESQSILAAAAAEPPPGFPAEPGPSLWPPLARQIRENPRPAVRSAWSLRPGDAWPARRRPLLAGLGIAAALLVGLGGAFAFSGRLPSVVLVPVAEAPAPARSDRGNDLRKFSAAELARMGYTRRPPAARAYADDHPEGRNDRKPAAGPKASPPPRPVTQ
jgi:anti-sigma factor RsiW